MSWRPSSDILFYPAVVQYTHALLCLSLSLAFRMSGELRGCLGLGRCRCQAGDALNTYLLCTKRWIPHDFRADTTQLALKLKHTVIVYFSYNSLDLNQIAENLRVKRLGTYQKSVILPRASLSSALDEQNRQVDIVSDRFQAILDGLGIPL